MKNLTFNLSKISRLKLSSCKTIVSVVFVVVLLLASSCNYPLNPKKTVTGINVSGDGTQKNPNIVAIQASKLTSAIQNYNLGTYTVFKVSGAITNEDYNNLINLIIEKKWKDWNQKCYVGLDLSAVTGLTKVTMAEILTKLVIPDSVSDIGDSCAEWITISDTNPNFIYENGVIYSADKTILIYYNKEKTEDDFEIPDTVKKVWAYSFMLNTNIKTITIPESVIYIGEGAFDNPNIRALTYKNKENWMLLNSYNCVISVNPEDLENIENYRWNSQVQKKGIFRYGLKKTELESEKVSHEKDWIDWKGAGSGTGTKMFKVNQINETEDVICGMKRVEALDRAQGTCVIRINNQSDKTEDAMCGFATCFTKNTDGTFNFLVVGVRIAEGGIPQTYASYFFNISEENLNKKNFGVGDNEKEKYDENYTEPYEIVIEKFPTKLNNISYDKNGTLTVAITFEQDTDNDINITWRKDVVENLQEASIKKDGNYTGTVINTAVAYANKTGRSDKSASGKLYTYANIYKGKTLNAEWRIYDVSWSKIGERSAEDDSIDSVGDIFFQEF